MEALLVLLGLGSIVGGDTWLAFYSMVAWTLLALAYVVVTVWAAWRRRLIPDEDTTQDPALPLKDWLVFLLGLTPVMAAFMGSLGGLIGLLPDNLADRLPEILETGQEEMLSAIRTVFNVVTVLMAILGWSLLHLSYARHYERLDHLHGPAFSFPNAKDPELTDYVYFAMTIGTTFPTSDVTITARRLRWTATVHSVLAFFYNAIVMAIAFKLITGG